MKIVRSILNIFLGIGLFCSLGAEEIIAIQKMPTGEIRLQKSPSALPPSATADLKIEVVQGSSEESPKIELNPPTKSSYQLTPVTGQGESLGVLQKMLKTPIQITVQNGKAKILWAGAEHEIALDAQGRFNLQIQP